MKLSTAKYRLFTLVLLSIIGVSVAQAAPPLLSIKSAVYNKKSSSLIVKTKINGGGLLTLLHSKGGVLGQTSDSEHTFTLPLAQLGDVPCQVEVRLGEMQISKAVTGASADCHKVPVCKIITPTGPVQTQVGQDVKFKAAAALKDKNARPLQMEWDFGGGAMGESVPGITPETFLRADKKTAKVKFVRDNSRYRVRFTAWDKQQRYCEDTVVVVVGTPPTSLTEFQTTLSGVEQMATTAQQSAPTLDGPVSGVAGDKVVLPFEEWTMQNITDARTVPNLPATFGPQVNTINALVYEKARQPVPLGTDKVELTYSAASSFADPAGRNSINSTSQNWPTDQTLMNAAVQKSDFFETWTSPTDGYNWSYSALAASFGFNISSLPDEGYHNPDLVPALNADHGRYMPGITEPYAANQAQAFSEFVSDANWFSARMLPVTDIDDLGRVNPYPLFRIQATDLQTGAATTTDTVLTISRDLHCRECHVKGGLGARAGSTVHHHDHTGHGDGGPSEFFDAESDSLFDQEYAAIRNISVIHGNSDFETGPLSKKCSDAGCHRSAIANVPYGQPLPSQETSIRVHGYHGLLQYNDARDDIQRTDKGLPLRFDTSLWDKKSGSNPKSLFPVKDAKGKILPMEQNCLRCHAGMREQCYRDRMYSAGVTCYQCHGDMLAVGGTYPKSSFNRDGRNFREAWFDEPDCASCHTGNGNLGKTGKKGFYSAGVMKTAFDETDRSATPRRADLFNPDERRFAVVPITDIKDKVDPQDLSVQLFRQGKDNHGQVPCAACHGAAHAVWPNRDPNANDNVTALQLQGHAGPIAECSVCHTADAFARFADLDEGRKAVDPKVNVLGGPHNMHPVNDSNWWKEAALDKTPNQISGKIAGGWHNDYAKLPGASGEDQCAACHGNDHRGTRLSQTPVDRQLVNEKGKTITVKAGTAIGCNLCHTIEKSCKDSPAGTSCGKASERVANTTNLPPFIAAQPVKTFLIGEGYRYDVNATDPEGGEVTFKISRPPFDGLVINPQSGLIDTAAPDPSVLASNDHHELMTADGHYPPFVINFRVIATDPQGAYSVQSVKVGIDCPDKLVWNRTDNACSPIGISSSLDRVGFNEGETYNYQVVAEIRSGLSVSYSLSNAPEGMQIDNKTGLISWVAAPWLNFGRGYTVIATDSQGHIASQEVNVTVCAKPDKWDDRNGRGCLSPFTINSQPTISGLNVGEHYDYQINAVRSDDLVLNYSLEQAPEGMTINSSTGAVHWLAQAETSTSIFSRINVTDSLGYFVSQDLSFTVCALPEKWRADLGQCHGPIDFTSESPVSGLVAGDTYVYAVNVTHQDNLPITYALLNAPTGMSIDAKTGVVSWLAATNPDGTVSFSIIANDVNGASGSQELSLSICAAGMRWDSTAGMCQGPVIIEPQTVFGTDVGATFTYPVIATLPGGGPINYSLINAPTDMTINATTGVVSWLAAIDYATGNSANFTVIASDQQGRQTIQNDYLTLCESPTHWNNSNSACE